MENPSSIRLGISACLLGQPVRYDGNGKLDRYLRDVLGKYVQWVAVCPEYECGLGVPREPVRLVQDGQSIRFVTVRTAVDKTEQIATWTEGKLDYLQKQDLCGFVFKTKSPSCALRDSKIYNKEGNVIGKGPGLFAARFMQTFPLIPVEDEGRLHDEVIRENFIERVFVYARWRERFRNGVSMARLVEWQRDHKLLLMAHSPASVRALGNLVANYHHSDNLDELAKVYFLRMTEALTFKSTVKKNVNVLYHIAGYFKRKISSDEKGELADVIESYHDGLVPLIVPVTLLKHYVRKYSDSYLKTQVYLNPHPLELKLRNHV
ncbi:MAG: YbgA family protein [Chitinispirillaceae bacterium]